MIKCIIIQSGNQIDAQPQAATVVAIIFRQNTEDFQVPYNMLDHHSFLCQLLVELFLFSRQFTAFRLLERCPRVGVQINQSLITAVRQTFDFRRQFCFAVFVKRKIVPFFSKNSRLSPNLSNNGAFWL